MIGVSTVSLFCSLLALVANAVVIGLWAFPVWVAVHADGTVAHRVAGELTPDQLDGLVELAAAPSVAT